MAVTGRKPISPDERRMPITMRLPAWLIAHWRATGKGWQTRLAEMLVSIERARRPQTTRKEK